MCCCCCFFSLYFLQLDSLQNPCADIGLEVESILQYRYQPDKEVKCPMQQLLKYALFEFLFNVEENPYRVRKKNPTK